MSRKPEPEKDYHVSIHVTKGYRYASTQHGFTDPKTGKRFHRQLHWGKLDENNKFIPGKEYLLASVEERKKLVFPEDWDLSEIEKLSGTKKNGCLLLEGQDEIKLYGDVWLLEQIAEVTGIRNDLLNVFGGNTEMVDIILTLAIFLMCGKGTYNELAAWQRTAKTPHSKPLTSPIIDKVLQSITEQDSMAMLRLRAVRVKQCPLCAVESASQLLRGRGDPFSDIHEGENNDQLPLQQTLDVVVYTLEDHVPIYYRTLPGKITDSGSLGTILKDLDSAGMKDVVFVTDRGNESIRNLEAYIDQGQPMIMGTNVSQPHVMSKIKSFGIFDHHPVEMEIDVDERLYYKQYDLGDQSEGYQEKVKPAVTLRVNLYLDPYRRSEELTDIDITIANQKKALEQLKTDSAKLDDDESIARAYSFYKLEYDESTRVLKGYTLDTDKVSRKRAMSGYFANATHKIDETAMESLRHYRIRDEQEKCLGMMESVMGADSQKNWSEPCKIGQSFILFVALALGCYLSNIRTVKLKDRFDSVPDILNVMRSICYIDRKGTQPYITPFVGKQITVCEAFGFKIPEECAPEYIIRKTNKGKRGRSMKNKMVVKED